MLHFVCVYIGLYIYIYIYMIDEQVNLISDINWYQYLWYISNYKLRLIWIIRFILCYIINALLYLTVGQ